MNVITISPDATVKEAARVMMEKKIGCLPVLRRRDTLSEKYGTPKLT